MRAGKWAWNHPPPRVLTPRAIILRLGFQALSVSPCLVPVLLPHKLSRSGRPPLLVALSPWDPCFAPLVRDRPAGQGGGEASIGVLPEPARPARRGAGGSPAAARGREERVRQAPHAWCLLVRNKKYIIFFKFRYLCFVSDFCLLLSKISGKESDDTPRCRYSRRLKN
jgi:hypothetical protein